MANSLDKSIEELLALDPIPYKAAHEEIMPSWLKENVNRWRKMRHKNILIKDCYYMELESDINVAEVENLISKEQANYLRDKYLW